MTALVLLAAALMVAPGRPSVAVRLRGLFPPPPAPPAPEREWLPPAVSGLACAALTATALGGTAGLVLAVPVGMAAGYGTHRVLRQARTPAADPLRLAGGWDLMAACLRCGLPVPVAVRAVADHVPETQAVQLRRIAERLALGADPADAWDVPDTSEVAGLAKAARRSAHTGAGLAAVAQAAAHELRAGAQDLAAARGQRAAVLITGPLGLCFLPAFLALGVIPVVIGLASGLAISW
jgi:hypothetical protein